MSKLRDKIREVYGTEGKFAKAFGITRSAMSMKLSGQRGWKIDQIIVAQQMLQIPDEQVMEYFGDKE